MNDFRSVWGVGGHFLLCFSGFPVGLAPWTGAPCSRTFAYMGRKRSFSNAFTTGLHLLTGKEKGGGFPRISCWSLVAYGEPHAAFLTESRTRGRGERRVSGNPGRPSCSTHVRESPRTWGTRPGGKAGEQARFVAQPTHDTYLRLGRQTRLFIRSVAEGPAVYVNREPEPRGDPPTAHSLSPKVKLAGPSATLGMTKGRAAAHLGVDGGGWIEPPAAPPLATSVIFSDKAFDPTGPQH